MKGLHASTDIAGTWLMLSVELIWLVLARRWTDESCQLCRIVKVTLEQVLTARTFVGKQIHLCKGHHLLFPFCLSLSPHLFLPFARPALSCSLFTSLAPAWVIFMSNVCRWLVAGPSARQRDARTAALSAFTSRQPDCTAMGGYITAAGTRPRMPAEMGAHSSNRLPLALCLHVTHSQIHQSLC